MDSSFLGTYDPKQVTLNISGLIISGFAEGTFIKVQRIAPELFKIHVGAHGEVSRTKNPDRSGRVTFTLKNTSPSNAKLDLLKYTPLPVPFGIKNNSDAKFMGGGTNSWLAKDPDVDFGMDEQNVEWILECDELDKSFF
jgi:hypothetical protein